MASRAGQGSGHNVFANAFSDPGLSTSTCTSASTSHAGFQFQFNDGQHSIQVIEVVAQAPNLHNFLQARHRQLKLHHNYV